MSAPTKYEAYVRKSPKIKINYRRKLQVCPRSLCPNAKGIYTANSLMTHSVVKLTFSRFSMSRGLNICSYNMSEAGFHQHNNNKNDVYTRKSRREGWLLNMAARF